MIQIVFLLISTLALLMALGTVLARNLVHAALYLVGFFFMVACQFVLLEAEFMAAMQVLVYIGAVAILLMFGIMLTRNVQGDETTGAHWMVKILAGGLCVALVAFMVIGVGSQTGVGGRTSWSDLKSRPVDTPSTDPEVSPGRYEAVGNMGRVIGLEMMTRWILPFEIAGLLLTAALVGAVALAMSDEHDEAPILNRMRRIGAGMPRAKGRENGRSDGIRVTATSDSTGKAGH